MKRPSLSQYQQPGTQNPEFRRKQEEVGNSIDLSKDLDFSLLRKAYQMGEFSKSMEMIEILEKRYPHHPELQNFKNDLQIKLSLKSIAAQNKKEQKRKMKTGALKLSGFAVIGIIIVMVTFYFSFTFFNDIVRANQLAEENEQLASLHEQANQLLSLGQPQPAAKIVEKMADINPDYESLPELVSRTDELLILEEKYQTAINLMAEHKNSEALVLLREIEAQKSGMWDVIQRIEDLESSTQSNHLFEGIYLAFHKFNKRSVSCRYH